MSVIRLGCCGGGQGEVNGSMLNLKRLPALLCSFVYLKGFIRNQHLMEYRDWALDSGAFSAFSSGTTINLAEYTETAKHLLLTDKRLVEVYALDVIGDAKASLQNCEWMWNHGVKAIPTFHINEPESFLLHLAKTYPKIAIGGVARLKGEKKTEFAKQVFARVWPKRIHGFGYGEESHIMAFPFHSTDATSWELGPCGFGRWKAYGSSQLRIKGSNQNLKIEIEHYLKLEDRAKARWASTLKKLDTEMQAVRLSTVGARTVKNMGKVPQ